MLLLVSAPRLPLPTRRLTVVRIAAPLDAAIKSTADDLRTDFDCLTTDNGPDLVKLCGAKGIRTPDLLDANESRYQLRHSPLIASRLPANQRQPETSGSLPRGAREVEFPGERGVVEMLEHRVFVVD